ncbi:MAG: transposase [Rhodocyclaceae bacterium]|nr:transposase [Rhodocyclaceae bacterium]
MRTKRYPSDITREQFLMILPMLEAVRRKTKPRTVDLYEVFCAVLYLLRTGRQWRTVHSYFAKWSEPDQEGVRDVLGEQVTVQVARRSELHTCKVIPKRWVVERSVAWLEKNRLLWKNCERWINTSLQFVHLAFLALLLKRL